MAQHIFCNDFIGIQNIFLGKNGDLLIGIWSQMNFMSGRYLQHWAVTIWCYSFCCLQSILLNILILQPIWITIW